MRNPGIIDDESGTALASSRLKMREDREGDIVILEPEGRVNSSTAPQLGERLTALLAGPGTRLIVDFRSLDYISSAGFRVLLLAAKQDETARSRLVLCSISGKVRRLFEIAEFLDLVPVYASREESLTRIGY